MPNRNKKKNRPDQKPNQKEQAAPQKVDMIKQATNDNQPVSLKQNAKRRRRRQKQKTNPVIQETVKPKNVQETPKKETNIIEQSHQPSLLFYGEEPKKTPFSWSILSSPTNKND